MKPKVYIETSVISYLTGRPSRDLVVAAKQQITSDWWKHSKTRFDRYISEFVVNEVSAGDSTAANKRLEVLEGLDLLEFTSEVTKLARKLIQGPIPQKAAVDAFHISIAAVHGMDFLVTWNCSHIANAEMRPKLIRLAEKSGFRCPIICTPEELMGD